MVLLLFCCFASVVLLGFFCCFVLGFCSCFVLGFFGFFWIFFGFVFHKKGIRTLVSPELTVA